MQKGQNKKIIELLTYSALLPESLDTFGIFPLRLLFSYDKKKKSLLLTSCRLYFSILFYIYFFYADIN